MKNNDKITLTAKQLKKLIKESIDDGKTYSWSITELRDDAGYGWEAYRPMEGSKINYDTAESAYSDGMKHLKTYDSGHYELEVWDDVDFGIFYSAEIHDGKITEY